MPSDTMRANEVPVSVMPLAAAPGHAATRLGSAHAATRRRNDATTQRRTPAALATSGTTTANQRNSVETTDWHWQAAP
jgi:hypothetical protein